MRLGPRVVIALGVVVFGACARSQPRPPSRPRACADLPDGYVERWVTMEVDPDVHVEVDPPDEVTREAVTAALRRANFEWALRRCYRHLVVSQRSLAGELRVRFSVDERGRPSGLVVDAAPPLRAVAQYLSARLRRAVLPTEGPRVARWTMRVTLRPPPPNAPMSDPTIEREAR
ncbi:MAG: hypothetical protein R3A52_11355 [Polyangiales bacterium]